MRSNRFEVINTETGEIEDWVSLEFNPQTHRGILLDKKKGIPQKQKDPFIRINKCMTELQFSNQERGIFLLLADLVGWEDNFIQDGKGTYLSITQFTKETGLTKKTCLSILTKLEEKGIVKIIKIGSKKSIYVYSKYIWFGFEKNRNDSKLKEIENNLLSHPINRAVRDKNETHTNI